MKQITLFDLEAFKSPSGVTTYDPFWYEIETAPEHTLLVREQVAADTLNTDTIVREQELDQILSAPEHTHWIEEYWVKRCGKKYKYWRYCWMEGRKIKRCHLGGVRSRLAKEKKADVEVWISDGQSPQEIEKLIRQQRHP